MNFLTNLINSSQTTSISKEEILSSRLELSQSLNTQKLNGWITYIAANGMQKTVDITTLTSENEEITSCIYRIQAIIIQTNRQASFGIFNSLFNATLESFGVKTYREIISQLGILETDSTSKRQLACQAFTMLHMKLRFSN